MSANAARAPPRLDLARVDHRAHQRGRVGRDGEVGEARGEARDAQDAHRILDERVADVPEQLRAQIRLPAERIDDRPDERAVRAHFARHRVDRQVAPHEILLERDVGRVIELEAVIAGRRLAFGARERVFLVRIRMQEHRKILADRPEALRGHLLGRRADDDVIAVAHRQAEQCVADRAAHRVELHRDGP